MPLREVTHNVFQTTLASNATAGATVITLTSVAGLSTTQPFRLRIDDDPTGFAGTYEIVLASSIVSSDVTVARGVDGTSGIAHSAGAKVTAVATKSFWDAAYDPPYRARAYAATTAQTVTTGTNVKVTLDTESYDSNNNFDNATNYRYTAPVSGFYLCIGRVEWATAISGVTQVVKNGSGNINSWGRGTYGTILGAPSLDVIQLAATDYVELWTRQDSGSTQTIQGGSGTTYMTVHWLGSL